MAKASERICSVINNQKFINIKLSAQQQETLETLHTITLNASIIMTAYVGTWEIPPHDSCNAKSHEIDPSTKHSTLLYKMQIMWISISLLHKVSRRLYQRPELESPLEIY